MPDILPPTQDQLIRAYWRATRRETAAAQEHRLAASERAAALYRLNEKPHNLSYTVLGRLTGLTRARIQQLVKRGRQEETPQ